MVTKPQPTTRNLLTHYIYIVVLFNRHYVNLSWHKDKLDNMLAKLKGLMWQGLSQAASLRQSHTAIEIVPLKNGQGDNLSPSKFREKTWKEAHTKSFISVQKLQAETERGKYISSHI